MDTGQPGRHDTPVISAASSALTGSTVAWNGGVTGAVTGAVTGGVTGLEPARGAVATAVDSRTPPAAPASARLGHVAAITIIIALIHRRVPIGPGRLST
jgi:hypothetical protein